MALAVLKRADGCDMAKTIIASSDLNLDYVNKEDMYCIHTDGVTTGTVTLNSANEKDVNDIHTDDLGDRRDRIVTLESMYVYHKLLMKTLSDKIKPEANICTRCGGLLDEHLKCIFCGAQHRMVANLES